MTLDALRGRLEEVAKSKAEALRMKKKPKCNIEHASSK